MPAAQQPSRRTLVKGAAWSVPVVTVASAAPAVAASSGCVRVLRASVCPVWKLVFTEFTYAMDFLNECGGSAEIRATVTARVGRSTEASSRDFTLAPGTSGRVEGSYWGWGFGTVPSSVTVSYTVDGIPAPPSEFSSPWPCHRSPELRTLQDGGASSSRPSDEEVREYLRTNPHLLEEKEVQEGLREYPQWDPRTSSEKTDAPTPADERVDSAAATASPDQ